MSKVHIQRNQVTFPRLRFWVNYREIFGVEKLLWESTNYGNKFPSATDTRKERGDIMKAINSEQPRVQS